MATPNPHRDRGVIFLGARRISVLSARIRKGRRRSSAPILRDFSRLFHLVTLQFVL